MGDIYRVTWSIPNNTILNPQIFPDGAWKNRQSFCQSGGWLWQYQGFPSHVVCTYRAISPSYQYDVPPDPPRAPDNSTVYGSPAYTYFVWGWSEFQYDQPNGINDPSAWYKSGSSGILPKKGPYLVVDVETRRDEPIPGVAVTSPYPASP